jgi:hypothetical protein
MTVTEEKLVWFDSRNRPPGSIDPSRMGKRNPNDTERAR